MTENTDSLKKAITLLMWIESQEKGLGYSILKSLSSKESKLFLSLLKEQSFIKENEIESVIEQGYDILIEKKTLMMDSKFLSLLDQEYNPEIDYQHQLKDQQKSLLSIFPRSFLHSLASNSACYALPLLCKLAKQEDINDLISQFDNHVSQDFLYRFSQISCSNLEILNYFIVFMLEVFQQQKDQYFAEDEQKQLALVLEQKPPHYFQEMKQRYPGCDWDAVERHMLKIESISKLNHLQLDRLMDHFEDAFELAVMLKVFTSSLADQIKNQLTDRMQMMLNDEVAKADLISDEDKQVIISKYVVILRRIIKEEDLL